MASKARKRVNKAMRERAALRMTMLSFGRHDAARIADVLGFTTLAEQAMGVPLAGLTSPAPAPAGYVVGPIVERNFGPMPAIYQVTEVSGG